FNMFNFPAPSLRLAGLAAAPVPVAAPGSPFDLTVYGIEQDAQLRVEVVYNSDLFNATRMTSFVDSVLARVESGIADPEAPVGALPAGATSRGALARRRVRRSTVVSTPPATPAERLVAGVWCEVLGAASVDVTESFFDAGGTSVSMVAVQQ